MIITDSPVDNGVNVQALLGAREALSAAPEAAQFTWRTRSMTSPGPVTSPRRSSPVLPKPSRPTSTRSRR